MSEIRTVADLMHSPDNIVSGAEPARQTVTQFEASNVRSLLVVGEHGPLGVLTRQRAESLNDDELNQPVRDFVTRTPVLSETMSIEEAGALAQGTDFEEDRLPVINADGKLVGVVRREELLQAARTDVTGEGSVALSSEHGALVDRSIRSGMAVYGSDNKKLGEVDQIVTERGAAVAFTVKHGLLGRSHKRIAAEHIASIDDDGVHLDFGKMEFNQLADVSEIETTRTL